MTTIVANGNTYVFPDDFTGKQYVTKLASLAQDLQADAVRNMVSTSTTSYELGTGGGTITISGPIPYQAGQYLLIMDAAAPNTNYALVTVDTTITGLSTSLEFTEVAVGGSGTKTSWVIAPSGPQAPAPVAVLAGSASGAIIMAGFLLTIDEMRMRKGIQWLNAESEKPDAVSGAQEIVLVDSLFDWLHINGTTTITITPDAAAGHGTAGQLLVQQDATGGRGHSFVGVDRWIGGTTPNPSMDGNYKALYGFEVAIDGTVLGWLIDEGF